MDHQPSTWAFRLRFEDRLERMRSALCLSDFDLYILSLLLALTAMFGPGFSKLSIDGSPIYITEILLGLTIVAATVRVGFSESLARIRALPMIPLVIYWIAGVIATVAGLSAEGISRTIEDVGLFEYSLILPVVAITATSAARLELIRGAVIAGAGLATIIYLASDLTTRVFDQDGPAFTVSALTFGLYMALLVAFVSSELAHERNPSRILVVLAALGLVLAFLTGVRAVWFGLFVGLTAVVVLAPPGRRFRWAGITTLVVCASLAVALSIEHVDGRSSIFTEVSGAVTGINAELGSGPPATLGSGPPATPSNGGGQSNGDGFGGPGSPRESNPEDLTAASLGAPEAANARWRLAFWKESIDRSLSQPIFGAGFGEPFGFRWEGQKYDFRDGDPTAAIDTSGNHNSFIYVMYRMGIPALLALLALVAYAFTRARSAATSTGDRARYAGLFAMVCGAMGVAFFTDALKDPSLALGFWVPLALLLAPLSVPRGLHRQSDVPRAVRAT